MDHITDHADLAVARLATEYRGKAGMEGLVRALAGEVQVLEDGIWGLVAGRALETAVGAQLDGYGSIVGEPRAGRDDDTYRLWIKVRRLVNRSSGTAEDLLGMYEALLAGQVVLSVVLEEYFPAALVLRIEGGACPAPSDYARILQLGKAAGVRAVFEWITVAPAAAFSFETGPGLGFADNAQTTGGALAGAV